MQLAREDRGAAKQGSRVTNTALLRLKGKRVVQSPLRICPHLLVGVILHLKSWVVCPLLLPLQLAAGAPGGLTEVGGGAWVEVGS
eukprot:1157385-Pelagomonas_calceolata.AAC.3